MTDGTPALTTTVEDGVAVARLDDGKVNVLSYAVLDALDAAMTTAEAEATALCLVGRPGKFSAGFDLSVMEAGVDAARALVGRGGEVMMRLFMHPQPVVAAVTGHALAGGALLTLCSDIRVGADLPAKIGLNETQIGMPLPLFALELAQHRLDPRYLTRATVTAEIFSPADAVRAGYLDRVAAADECETVAIEEARRLSGLHLGAYAQTKQALRQTVADTVWAGGAADLERFSVAST